MLHNQPLCSSRLKQPDILPLAQGFGFIPAKWDFSNILPGLLAFVRDYDVLNRGFSLLSPGTLEILILVAASLNKLPFTSML